MTLVRFAPSPTGYLHTGNARTALINWLFAHRSGGKFLLRIDDTDVERSKPEFETAILEDMRWLGLTHDLFARQIARAEKHRTAAERLKEAGQLYPCYETAAELDRRRKRQIAMGKPPVYDRAALALSAVDRAKLESEGRKPHWRFKLSQTRVKWHDLIRGEVEIDTGTSSDPVLVREDGSFLYTLPSVADDIDFGVTHIIRGEDHVTNTAAQIEIFEALGSRAPHFAHFPLLIGAGGEALSKRAGSLALRDLRDAGIEPFALDCYLAKMGTSDPVELRPSLEALAADFAFGKFGRAPAHFDPAELLGLNTKFLHSLEFTRVADRLQKANVGGGAPFWDAVRPNISRFSDVTELWKVVAGPVVPVIEDVALTTVASKLLPAEPWDENTWSLWTSAISGETGAKGRALYHPLRLALTGSDHGPEMKKLLPLIGREKALVRLKGERA